MSCPLSSTAILKPCVWLSSSFYCVVRRQQTSGPCHNLLLLSSLLPSSCSWTDTQASSLSYCSKSTRCCHYSALCKAKRISMDASAQLPTVSQSCSTDLVRLTCHTGGSLASKNAVATGREACGPRLMKALLELTNMDKRLVRKSALKASVLYITCSCRHVRLSD